ncbi:MAG: hypothetical protein LUO98_02095 [Methanoregula sp.]|nr:hypothetical protein [Methanoregula sp.]
MNHDPSLSRFTTGITHFYVVSLLNLVFAALAIAFGVQYIVMAVLGNFTGPAASGLRLLTGHDRPGRVLPVLLSGLSGLFKRMLVERWYNERDRGLGSCQAFWHTDRTGWYQFLCYRR